jgi:hypothetical protein
MDRRALLLAGFAVLAAPARADAPDLAVGQEWSAKDTPGKVIIGRIDRIDGRDVISVSLVDVPTELGPTVFAHAPFAKAALVASLDKLLATGVAPDADFEAGYEDWKATHGAVFTVSVARAIGFATHGAGK